MISDTDLLFVAVRNGDININTAVMGDGPLVVFVHGFPELWYSWRHQMRYFAAQGYRTAAIDVRGYGGSSAPYEIEAYTLTHVCADVAAVIDHLGDGEPAIVVGHDWGAMIAWNTARLHPAQVRAVCGLSVPYNPVGPRDPLDHWRRLFTDQGKFFYQVYFDDEGVAEAELGADTLASLRQIYFASSADAHGLDLGRGQPVGAGYLDGLIDPDPFPAWADDSDLAVFAAGIDASGWRGPLNKYRAQRLDAEQLGSRPDPNLKQPAAFIGGEVDPVRHFVEGVDLFDYAAKACDDFRGSTIIPGAGHWVQQEQPAATNEALAAFFDSL